MYWVISCVRQRLLPAEASAATGAAGCCNYGSSVQNVAEAGNYSVPLDYKSMGTGYVRLGWKNILNKHQVEKNP